MSQQTQKHRAAAWRTAAIATAGIVVYVAGIAQGMQTCIPGWPF